MQRKGPSQDIMRKDDLEAKSFDSNGVEIPKKGGVGYDKGGYY
jgi:hypothetical protein